MKTILVSKKRNALYSSNTPTKNVTSQVRKKLDAQLTTAVKEHNYYAKVMSRSTRHYHLQESVWRRARPHDPIDAGAENFSYKRSLRTKFYGLMQEILDAKKEPYLFEGNYISESFRVAEPLEYDESQAGTMVSVSWRDVLAHWLI